MVMLLNMKTRLNTGMLDAKTSSLYLLQSSATIVESSLIPSMPMPYLFISGQFINARTMTYLFISGQFINSMSMPYLCTSCQSMLGQ